MVPPERACGAVRGGCARSLGTCEQRNWHPQLSDEYHRSIESIGGARRMSIVLASVRLLRPWPRPRGRPLEY